MGDQHDSDAEEVFFGQMSQAEKLRRQQLFGPNYSTPPLGNTPRPRHNHPLLRRPGTMPDVLGQLNFDNRNEQSPQIITVHSSVSSSDDVIILDSPEEQAHSTSVIVLSDDDSFQINESHNFENSDRNKDSICENNNFNLSKPTDIEVCESNNRECSLLSEENLDSIIDAEEREINHIQQPTLNEAGVGRRNSISLNKSGNIEISDEEILGKINDSNCVTGDSKNTTNDSQKVGNDSTPVSCVSSFFGSKKLNEINKDSFVSKEIEEQHATKSSLSEISDFFDTTVDPQHNNYISSINHNYNDEPVVNLNYIQVTDKMTVEENIEYTSNDSSPTELPNSVESQHIVKQDSRVSRRFDNKQHNNSESSDNFATQEVEEITVKLNISALIEKHDNVVEDGECAENSYFSVEHKLDREQFEESNSAQKYFQDNVSSLSVVSNDNNSCVNAEFNENPGTFSMNYETDGEKPKESDNFEMVCNQNNPLEVRDISEKVSCEGMLSQPKEYLFENKVHVSPRNKKNSVNGNRYSLGNLSGLSVTENSLNGITDSILNCSYGSSLPSPLDASKSPAVTVSGLYEDISYDGTDVTLDSNVHQETTSVNDLHMSVDEVDCQHHDSGAVSLNVSGNISQPSEYKSCSSAFNSFCTALNYRFPETISEQSNTFYSYRETCDDSVALEETDKISFKSDEEHINEASFQMVMQDRQNSYNDIVTIHNENKQETAKQKPVSKLPIYTNTKNLLRQPKLCVKPDSLKTSSYKLAKSFSESKTPSKTQSQETKPTRLMMPSGLKRPLASPIYPERKIASLKPFSKTPAKNVMPTITIDPPTPLPKTPAQNSNSAKIKTPQNSSMNKNKTPQNSSMNKNKTPQNSSMNKNKTPQNSLLEKSKTPQNSLLEKSKTPEQNSSMTKRIFSPRNTSSTKTKTPTQNISTHIPKLIKSDKKDIKGSTPLSLNKSNKYKNVISPIHAYINRAPTVTQTKAHIITEETVCGLDNKVIFRSKENKDSPAKTSKAVQRLQYGSGQENFNPNVVISPNRETLPVRILEEAQAVFWKESEEPQSHLPKMGEKLTHILLSPMRKEAKVTVHEGRVKDSPNTKGVLVPNSSAEHVLTEESQPYVGTTSKISVRLQKPAEML